MDVKQQHNDNNNNLLLQFPFIAFAITFSVFHALTTPNPENCVCNHFQSIPCSYVLLRSSGIVFAISFSAFHALKMFYSNHQNCVCNHFQLISLITPIPRDCVCNHCQCISWSCYSSPLGLCLQTMSVYFMLLLLQSPGIVFITSMYFMLLLLQFKEIVFAIPFSVFHALISPISPILRICVYSYPQELCLQSLSVYFMFLFPNPRICVCNHFSVFHALVTIILKIVFAITFGVFPLLLQSQEIVFAVTFSVFHALITPILRTCVCDHFPCISWTY